MTSGRFCDICGWKVESADLGRRMVDLDLDLDLDLAWKGQVQRQ